MYQLSSPKERNTINTFLRTVFITYLGYWLIHASVGLTLIEKSKVTLGYCATLCLVYFFAAYKSWESKKLLSESNFSSSRLQKSLSWIYIFNITAPVVC